MRPTAKRLIFPAYPRSEAYAFYGCTGLTEITIPNITSSVNTYAFAECTKLAEVNIGSP